MFYFLALILVLYLVYYILNSKYRYWQKKGIIGPRPKFLVGNLGPAVFLKTSIGRIYTKIYNEYNEAPVVGMYSVFSPVLVIRDPDVIHDVTIKSFAHFHDNDVDFDKKTDPIFGRNPFVLRGQEWKLVRRQLTPGFTSSKMKWLYPLLEENSKALVKYIAEKALADCYELKELSARFTLNNVATCAFGLNGKCFVEDRSEFRQLANEFFSPESWSVLILYLSTAFPAILKLFPLRFVSKKVEKKLVDLVSETLKYREKNNIVRNDFLHIMNELKKTCKDFTDLDVTAHAAAFFADGYETSSAAMSFILYFLGTNSNAQNKLREELIEAFANNNDTIPYEVLQSLPYLEAVINETLRIQSPILFLRKVCTENYHDPSRSLNVEKGTSIILPMHAIHNDPKFFDQPDHFKPERFLGANKEKIKKCTFFPFGEGPRACLGQRFGVLQIKVGIAYIIKNYEITLNQKTKLPLSFDPANIIVSPIGGLWVNFMNIK